MSTQVIDIGLWQLALCLVFVLTAGAASLWYRLGLGKDLLVGTVRAVAQLFAMGYVLKFVFALDMAGPVIGLFLIMTATAAHLVRGRVKGYAVPVAIPTFLSMFISYGLVSFLVVGVIVGAKPWWTPQYFIPLAGMIVGNSMSAIALSLERMFSELKARRQVIEMQLCLGATPYEASRGIMADAIRAGMIPSINSLMGVGLVFLPGMMTGQILAGADPLVSIRYQIVVMLMLVAATAIGSVLVTRLVFRRCFSASGRPVLRG
ncbi:ABC transporter permease [Desulfovibrio oxyclinae]|uniref:ABC transporter permease n=1 Tax=Desulfovibrio oxyclinae TaxID=63560 RepID=UPI0003722E3B|nr:iron export ABC transporter permease subunit FetB [Desulfovibrio oxyclinae]